MSDDKISPPIFRLSLELLSAIFARLQPSASTVASCSLCCKLWHPLAQAALYRDLVLGHADGRLSRFTALPRSSAVFVHARSLTVRVKPLNCHKDEDWTKVQREGSKAAQQLWPLLNKLVTYIMDMTRLQSLSIYQTQGAKQGGWISRAILAKLLESLPPSCTSLDINLPDADTSPAAVHLCPSIQSLLPRLEYLRLQLAELCPDILMAGFNSEQPVTKPEIFPINAPHLKHCVINTGTARAYGTNFLCCSTSQPSWIALTPYLRAFVEAGHAPALEKLWLLSMVDQDPRDRSSYHAWVRRNICSDTSRALPFRKISMDKDGFLVRLPVSEGQDWISTWEGIELLAEGPAWQETAEGSRLPVALMLRYGMLPALIALNREDYNKQRAGRGLRAVTCGLWRNESLSGMEILITADGGLTDEHFVREMTPEGMVRRDDWLYPVEKTDQSTV